MQVLILGQNYAGVKYLTNIMCAALICFTGTDPLLRARCHVRENPQFGAKPAIVDQRAEERRRAREARELRNQEALLVRIESSGQIKLKNHNRQKTCKHELRYALQKKYGIILEFFPTWRGGLPNSQNCDLYHISQFLSI